MQKEYTEKLTDLIESGLEDEACILFIGPEFLKLNGKNYNFALYESLPDTAERNEIDKEKAKYNSVEKIWSFTSKPIQDEFFGKLRRYIKNNRDLTDDIYLKLAAIPFPLIVSLLPDDTIEQAFNQFDNFDYSFTSFFTEEEIPEASKDNLSIYNLFGNIQFGMFLASHSDYLNFVIEYAKNKFPQKLKIAIKKAKYLVFLGFEADKWYNILLLYILNNEKKTTKYIINMQSTEELLKSLSDESLNVMFINEEYKDTDDSKDKNKDDDKEFVNEGNEGTNGSKNKKRVTDKEFINDLYEKIKEVDEDLLRKVLPKRPYLENKIKRKKQTLIASRKVLNITTDPIKRLNLEMEIEKLEKEIEELMKQLKKLL